VCSAAGLAVELHVARRKSRLRAILKGHRREGNAREVRESEENGRTPRRKVKAPRREGKAPSMQGEGGSVRALIWIGEREKRDGP
jgi:hypothetical protein